MLQRKRVNSEHQRALEKSHQIIAVVRASPARCAIVNELWCGKAGVSPSETGRPLLHEHVKVTYSTQVVWGINDTSKTAGCCMGIFS